MAVFRVYGKSMEACIAKAEKLVSKKSNNRSVEVTENANALFARKPVPLKSFETLAGCESLIELLKSKPGFADLRIYARYPSHDINGQQLLTKKKAPIFRWLPLVKGMDHC